MCSGWAKKVTPFSHLYVNIIIMIIIIINEYPEAGLRPLFPFNISILYTKYKKKLHCDFRCYMSAVQS